MLKKLIEWREAFFSALPENRRLERIWFIAKTDFKKRYYGSFLGLIWALLNPLLRLSIYYIVFTLVFQSRTEQFILFLYIGIIHFIFFSESVTKGMMIFRSKSFLLENIQINQFDIYYSNLLSGLLGFLFNFGIFFIIRLFLVEAPIDYSILLYPVLLINLMIFVHAVSLLLSIIWAFFKDIVHIWNILRMALMWLSGTFFEIDPTPGSRTEIFAYLNPLAGLLINIRNITIYNKPVIWSIFIYDFIYALIILIIGYYLFKSKSRFALEKM